MKTINSLKGTKTVFTTSKTIAFKTKQIQRNDPSLNFVSSLHLKMVKTADHSAVIFGTHFPNRIFVGCLPAKATAQHLAEFFSNFGNVNEAKIVLDENGNSKRFGFVSFAREDDVNTVLQHGSIFFWGKKINVGPAIKKKFSDDVKGKPATLVFEESILRSGGKSRVVYQPIENRKAPVTTQIGQGQKLDPCPLIYMYPTESFPPQFETMPAYQFYPNIGSPLPPMLPDQTQQTVHFQPTMCSYASLVNPNAVMLSPVHQGLVSQNFPVESKCFSTSSSYSTENIRS